MKKKKILMLSLFLLLTIISYSKNMKTILNSKLNTRAVGLKKNEVWKKISFKLPYRTKVKITVIATANDNGSRDDDDIKWALDKTSFGWATENAWDGRETKGKKKKVEINKTLLAGRHTLTFWADQNPVLNSIKIEMEQKVDLKKPEIKEISYLPGIGMKLTWEKSKDIKEYQVFRKEKNGKFQKIVTTNLPAYIDMKVKKGISYTYRIGLVDKNGKIRVYTKDYIKEVEEKIEAPKNLKITKKKDEVAFSWEQENESEIISYNIYKKSENEERMKKYSIAVENKFIDQKVEAGLKYLYQVSAINLEGKESEKSKALEIIVEAANYNPKGVADIFPKDFSPGDNVKIYFSDRRSKELRSYRKKAKRRDPTISSLPEQMYIHYGYNNWDPLYTILEKDDPKMKYNAKTKYWEIELKMPSYVKEMDFVFKDELDNWDTNWSKDYKFKAKKDLEAPEIVTGIKVTERNSLVYLEWDKSKAKDLGYYKVIKSDLRSGFEKRAKTIEKEITENYYSDKEVVGGKNYYYSVVAYDVNGNKSKIGVIKKATPKKTGVLLKKICEWEPFEPSQGEKIKIYYNKEKGKFKEEEVFLKLGTNNWEKTEKDLIKMKKDKIFDAWYFETKVEPGTKNINIAFTNNKGAWETNLGSNWNIKVKEDKIAPKQIEKIKIEVKLEEVILTWKANSESDFAGYNVYRNNKKSNVKLLKNNKFVDSEIEGGETYNYSVTAVDMSGNESEKNGQEIKTLEDLINTPPERVYITKISKGMIRLIGSIDKTSKWRIDILTAKNKVIRTLQISK
ncbi:MAG: hypothetical protein B6I28_04700 [Fusobacteriia bacterium 4572_132]|nr:MAG: hypothetical protein B6I28_04700 [Fusobacteriia bacterium 4572_132]